jgi:hypothetical protein
MLRQRIIAYGKLMIKIDIWLRIVISGDEISFCKRGLASGKGVERSRADYRLVPPVRAK